MAKGQNQRRFVAHDAHHELDGAAATDDPLVSVWGVERRAEFSGARAAVSWPWVPAWGSLEPCRRDGENAQKSGGKRG